MRSDRDSRCSSRGRWTESPSAIAAARHAGPRTIGEAAVLREGVPAVESPATAEASRAAVAAENLGLKPSSREFASRR